MNETFQTILKGLKMMLALLVAATLVYRGNTYIDPKGPGMMVPAMCIVLAMLVIGSTLAMTFKSQDREAEMA